MKWWRCFTIAFMTSRHYAFSRQRRAQFSKDIYAFVLWRSVTVHIWRVEELFVPVIVASTLDVACGVALVKVHVYANLVKAFFLCSSVLLYIISASNR